MTQPNHDPQKHRDLARNWDIDIASSLEDYLEGASARQSVSGWLLPGAGAGALGGGSWLGVGSGVIANRVIHSPPAWVDASTDGPRLDGSTVPTRPTHPPTHNKNLKQSWTS